MQNQFHNVQFANVCWWVLFVTWLHAFIQKRNTWQCHCHNCMRSWYVIVLEHLSPQTGIYNVMHISGDTCVGTPKSHHTFSMPSPHYCSRHWNWKNKGSDPIISYCHFLNSLPKCNLLYIGSVTSNFKIRLRNQESLILLENTTYNKNTTSFHFLFKVILLPLL